MVDRIMKILIADDDTVMLSLLRTLMELEDNQVVTATRPEEIIPTVEREQPALILMDYNLAGGNSMDALDTLKSDSDLRKIPIIVTSGMDRKHECIEAGADDFILKPFRPAQLIEHVQEIARQSLDQS